MRWLILAAGLIFSLAIGKAAFLDNAGEASLSPLSLVLILVASSLIFVLLFAKASAKSSDFEGWMDKNASLILSQGALYNGRHITGNSETRVFLLTISIVFMTFRVPSRPYLAEENNLGLARAAHTLGSLVLGWWGIPWGPIYTVQSVVRNIEGGSRGSVGGYLDYLSKRRVVQKDHPMLLFTKGLGAALLGILFALVSGAVMSAANSSPWVIYVGAALIGALAAAWTWTYGRAWIK